MEGQSLRVGELQVLGNLQSHQRECLNKQALGVVFLKEVSPDEDSRHGRAGTQGDTGNCVGASGSGVIRTGRLEGNIQRR